jgi:fructose-bisphosphate aldolase class II
MNLQEIIKDAQEKKIAIGHFNFSNLEGLWAIFNAARELNVPVIAGVSEGERDFVGVQEAMMLVKSLRERFSYPIFLNADHTYSVERVEEVVRAGYDAVIFDGAKLPFAENIQKTKEAVERAKSINPDILVEGEFGYIGTSSKILKEVPEGVALGEEDMTSPTQAEQFVRETGIDLFAPSVGNIHGIIVAESFVERLNISRIEEIRKAVSVPLVLHGGSGLPDSDFQNAIRAGIACVHINTELRAAFTKGIKEAFNKNPDEIAPYKYMKEGRDAMQEVAKKRLKLFNFLP